MNQAPEIIARKFLNRTNRHLFLTGRAGTGKTTFLRGILDQTHKKAVIAAPTGVAAINAGGVTLHSLFQLPFGSFVPDNSFQFTDSSSEFQVPSTLARHMHMAGSKRRLLQEMELLIIDEVSMLRADILDAIDHVLRRIRRNTHPFGGIQILFIGDLLQLPPVVKDEEWSVLKNYYRSIHFFEARALKGQTPVYLELEKIYRQHDPVFIELLNRLRDNEVTRQDIELLNSHYKPGFIPGKHENYIHLTTHNRFADSVNTRELQRLTGKNRQFECSIEDDFRDHQYPIDPVLVLKEGAQVMFIKNDTSEARQFFNGKIGTVTKLGKDRIKVNFSDGTNPVNVERHTWLNKRYKLDIASNEIKEELLGTFTHFPIKLAWAVTIHKSQGLTFDQAIIDIQRAFAPGQVYVALSRLTSLKGLVLSSPAPVSCFVKDENILAFSKTRQEADEIGRILESETHLYLMAKLTETFDLSPLENGVSYHLWTYNKDEKRSAKQRYKSRIIGIQAKLKPELSISARFIIQIRNIADQGEGNYLEQLQDRIVSATEYFEPRLSAISGEILAIVKELSSGVGVKAYLRELKELESSFFSKIQAFRKAQALIKSALRNEDLMQADFIEANEKEEREKLAVDAPKKKKGKKPANKLQKGNSRKESYKMFKSGKSVAEISRERELTIQTIQGHLTPYIREGDLDILELLEEDRVNLIRLAIHEYYRDSIVPVKDALGDNYTYGEIRWVMAAFP